MTDRRDLKRRIRERQDKTGERYTTARAHVLAAREPPEWVVELTDVTPRARALGFGLDATICVTTAALRDVGPELDGVLARLRDIVTAPLGGLDALRHALLGAEREPPRRAQTRWYLDEVERFLTGLELGLRGHALGGRLLAFDALLRAEVVTIVAEVLFPTRGTGDRVVLSRYAGGQPRLVFFSRGPLVVAAR